MQDNTCFSGSAIKRENKGTRSETEKMELLVFESDTDIYIEQEKESTKKPS